MRINNYNKFFAKVAKIMNTDVKAVKCLDGRYKVELSNHVYLNVYRGVSGSLFVHDHRGIAHITSCYDFDDFKTMKDLYERLVLDYSESDTETTETSETSENEESTPTQNADHDRTKYLMETHSFPSTNRYSYREVEKVCGDCSHFNACMQGNQTVAPTCCMFDSLYKARKNPEWHHVSLKTLANIDNDMLDKKRRDYMYLYCLIKDFRKYAFEINRRDVYFELTSNVLRNIQQLYFNNVISYAAYHYATKHVQVVGVENGYFLSEREETFGFKESRRYNVRLR